MSNEIKLIECPRDAWQGLKGQIPSAVKVQYLRALIGAGFKHIDAVSFVSPKAIPQMADSEEVLKQLDPPDDVEIIGIVVNQKGAERAIATEAVQTLGYVFKSKNPLNLLSSVIYGDNPKFKNEEGKYSPAGSPVDRRTTRAKADQTAKAGSANGKPKRTMSPEGRARIAAAARRRWKKAKAAGKNRL